MKEFGYPPVFPERVDKEEEVTGPDPADPTKRVKKVRENQRYDILSNPIAHSLSFLFTHSLHLLDPSGEEQGSC